MDKIMKRQNGITLVALIITIIVMLILAGVAISMAVGDNGVIERTQEALKENERADVQEIIIGSYVFKVTGSFNSFAYIDIPKTGIAIYENLTANGFTVLNPQPVKDENNNDVMSAPITKDENENPVSIDINVKGDHGEYEGTVESSGLVGNVVEKEIIEEESPDNSEEIEVPPTKGNANTIKASDYGKVVSNYTAGGQTWEILYADEDNVYLITREAVVEPVKSGKKLSSVISEYSNSQELTNEETKENYPAAQKWFATWLSSGLTSSDDNMKGTLFILDSTVWNGTYKNEQYADYAIGGPTLELFLASYNKLYNANVSAGNPIKGSGWDGTAGGYYYDMIEKIEEENVLNRDSLIQYWIASPSKSSKTAMISFFGASGNLSIPYVSSTTINGFRPVVCLKTSVVLEANTTNSDGTVATYKIK